MQTNTLVYLIVNVLTLSIAQILIKQGSSSLKGITFSLSGMSQLVGEVIGNLRLLSGIILFSISFIFYLLALSEVRLNFAQPFTVAASMTLILIGSWVFLGEKLTFYQVLGIVLMIIGIFFVFKSS